ncbi:MAG TPA: acyltransferase [Terriglobia bacterium]|nr:acyltransferase [Terriglobia bacterium]
MKRNQPLDILRGIAILLVLGYHSSGITVLKNFGWTGVDLFFVLSGFLISGLLFSEFKKHGRINVVRFWIRRGFKIYPAFYLLMILTGVVCLVGRGGEPRELLYECLFIQNYMPRIWPHTWSLAVEEHFYLALPILLIVMCRLSSAKKNPFGKLPWVFAGVAVTCLVMRIAEFRMGTLAFTIRAETHLRIDSLFIGVLLGYFKHFYSARFANLSRKPLWLLGIFLLFPSLLSSEFGEYANTIGMTTVYLGYSCFLVWAVEKSGSPFLLSRGVSAIGRYSYSIYLWQGLVFGVLFKGHYDTRFLLLGAPLAVAFGILMSHWIELPSLKVRDRFFPSRSVQRKEPKAKLGSIGPAVENQLT